jgi:hypothetical protein
MALNSLMPNPDYLLKKLRKTELLLKTNASKKSYQLKRQSISSKNPLPKSTRIWLLLMKK